MKREFQFALATGALVLGLGGVASAAMSDRDMSMMHGSHGMPGMSGGGFDIKATAKGQSGSAHVEKTLK